MPSEITDWFSYLDGTGRKKAAELERRGFEVHFHYNWADGVDIWTELVVSPNGFWDRLPSNMNDRPFRVHVCVEDLNDISAALKVTYDVVVPIDNVIQEWKREQAQQEGPPDEGRP